MKKLIPMSDNEKEQNSLSDINLAAPSICDSVFDINSTNNTAYGDFSMNSFVIVDTEDFNNKKNDDEISYVYMESIIDLMKGLNMKIDSLKTEKSKEKHVLERVMSFLTIGDSRSAEETIQCYNGSNSPAITEIFLNLIQKSLPNFFISLKEELLKTKEIALGLKNVYLETDTRLFKKLEENERLKNIINQQSKDHRIQIDDLSKENNYLKDEILKIATEIGNNTKMESLLEEDILESLKAGIRAKCIEMESLKEKLSERELSLQEYHLKESSFDISHLNSQIESFKKSQKKLQDENLNLTQIVNKLSEKNTKIKQDLIFFNSELKKAMEVLAKKNDTIARQKSLIELFQEKLSGSSFPIEELRRKKLEVEKKLIKETDYFVKQSLKKESEDCEKRLSDFLSLNRRI